MRRSIALMAMFSLAVAACGGDDGGEGAAACDAFIAIDQAFTLDEDLEAGTVALEDFVAAAPDNVASEVEPLIPFLKDDVEAALESDELAAAEAAGDAYALDNCGDTRVDVEGFNFAFPGMPSELEAGRVAFNLTNQTQTDEAHEALLLRKNDGVTETPHDILSSALGASISVDATLEALEQFTLVAVGFVEPEGGDTQDVFVADLEPGEYIVACLLPVNSADLLEAYFAGEELEGSSHFDAGMFAEFTVK